MKWAPVRRRKGILAHKEILGKLSPRGKVFFKILSPIRLSNPPSSMSLIVFTHEISLKMPSSANWGTWLEEILRDHLFFISDKKCWSARMVDRNGVRPPLNCQVFGFWIGTRTTAFIDTGLKCFPQETQKIVKISLIKRKEKNRSLKETYFMCPFKKYNWPKFDLLRYFNAFNVYFEGFANSS